MRISGSSVSMMLPGFPKRRRASALWALLRVSHHNEYLKVHFLGHSDGVRNPECQENLCHLCNWAYSLMLSLNAARVWFWISVLPSPLDRIQANAIETKSAYILVLCWSHFHQGKTMSSSFSVVFGTRGRSGALWGIYRTSDHHRVWNSHPRTVLR